jgi:hypothetical protein
VLRKIPKGRLKGKMHGKWEGPFIATATSNEEAFKLRRLTGEEEPYTWNVDAPEVLRLRTRRSGNPLYLSYIALFLFRM